ncbi:hypothetical protein PHSY_005092 [Pseudozyma hubeiensis SY62]|uniref:Uncharacterized protein n=1 Tax=Pseudozyma hubeiensis (strain SY62) TaxID=1305764 RepID=R9P814_PSEHS|nr:hypothetical protein PHSY_005092 [Pseudozyma hubeiensis SY62]GAC97506.1 hypothetical protein PHSY_005092 [Pseudozyma hubeiensis SY62]
MIGEDGKRARYRCECLYGIRMLLRRATTGSAHLSKVWTADRPWPDDASSFEHSSCSLRLRSSSEAARVDKTGAGRRLKQTDGFHYDTLHLLPLGVDLLPPSTDFVSNIPHSTTFPAVHITVTRPGQPILLTIIIIIIIIPFTPCLVPTLSLILSTLAPSHYRPAPSHPHLAARQLSSSIPPSCTTLISSSISDHHNRCSKVYFAVLSTLIFFFACRTLEATATMLVYMSQYVEERSAAQAPAAIRTSAKPATSKTKKGKINFVSKASLAMFDPRLAMGIDSGNNWYDGSSSPSSFSHSAQPALRHSEDSARNQQWTTSPTPELEAFATPTVDEPYHGSSSAAGAAEMTRQPSASSSVFEDDRDIPETSSRRRFLSRKSVAQARAATPTDDVLFSPLGAKVKPNRSAGAASVSSASSFSRFFARKKKDKASHLGGLASRSTPDLFDGVPQSAPPTTMTFEQSGFTFSPQRKASDSCSLYDSPSSLPTSPERRPVRLAQDFSPVHTSPLSVKQSMPALRQIREAHNAASTAQTRSIVFASPEKRQRPRQSTAPSRNDSFDVAPALPPLPSFDTSSPMIPLEFAWDSKRGVGRESQMPSTGSNARPISRVVSSTSRGVPSPGLNPIRLNDPRKSTLTLRNEPALRFADDVKSAPAKSSVTRPAASPRRAEKRLSMTQKVVDGLLDQDRGREEPEMRSRRVDMEVRSARRRSRSVDGRTLSSFKQNDVVSPASSNSHSDSVFPAFVRHAPASPGRASSPQPRYFAEVETANSVTPTPKQPPSFSTPTSTSPSRSAAQSIARSPSPASRSPQRKTSGETHQARRVNFVGQRAKAVAVASPLLLSKSPRLGGGRSGTPLPVVNIMPPTPDLGVSEQDERVQAAAPQQEHEITAPSQTVTREPAVAAVEAPVAVKAAGNISSQVKTQVGSVARAVSSRKGATTPTPATKPVVVAQCKSVETAPVVIMSPESVYSPASVYSPEANDGAFSSLHGILTGDGEVMTKEDLQVTADSVAAELSYVGMPRTDSVTSELSEVSSARSSSSGAFAFSRSMSNSSLNSGGTFSSASSNASESPERKMGFLPSVDSFDFSPTKITNSSSVASSIGTSIFEVEAELRSSSTAKGEPVKLKTPFELKGLGLDADAAQSAGADSSDCETPTLASCRQMGVNARPRDKAQQEKIMANRQLGLSMDLSDLAQELGLGRLSQIGLAHLKGIESLAEVPARQPNTTSVVAKKVQPIKPPKSSARIAGAASSSNAVGAAAADAKSAPRFGMGMKDFASSAAMSPLPVSIAGRSPQTPPRKPSPMVETNPGRIVSASGVPKADGGFGLGLNFVESPSPQAPLRKAAIAPGSYGQHVLEQTHIIPSQFYQQPQHSYHAHEQQQEEEAEWVGVAM